MMIRTISLSIFFVMTATTTYMYAADDVVRSVDVSQFDVAGVKLGMTQSEAVAAATAKLKIDITSVEFEKSPKENPVTKSKEPMYFTATNGSGNLIVGFHPKIPTDKSNPMLVSFVKYEMPSTPDNVQSMEAAALEKYGQPTLATSAAYQWCSSPAEQVGCTFFQGPRMGLSRGVIILDDPTYKKAVDRFIEKSQSSKPAF